MDFVNARVGMAATTTASVHQTPSGAINTEFFCDTVRLVDPWSLDGLIYFFPDLFMITWMVVLLFTGLNDAVRYVNGLGAVCVTDPEFYLHILTCTFAIFAVGLRLVLAYQTTRLLGVNGIATQDYPSPYVTFLPDLATNAHYATVMLSIALWLCLLRFSFYISLFGKRFNVLRKTLWYGFVRLLPLLAIVLVGLGGFTLFAHIAYGPTMNQFRDMQVSFNTAVAMMRRPALLDIEDVHAADIVLTMQGGKDIGVSFVTPIFLTTFIICVALIASSMLQAVVIVVYSHVNLTFANSEPDDIVPDSPWPVLDPVRYVRGQLKKMSARMHAAAARKYRVRELNTQMAVQQQKAAEEFERQRLERLERLGKSPSWDRPILPKHKSKRSDDLVGGVKTTVNAAFSTTIDAAGCAYNAFTTGDVAGESWEVALVTGDRHYSAIRTAAAAAVSGVARGAIQLAKGFQHAAGDAADAAQAGGEVAYEQGKVATKSAAGAVDDVLETTIGGAIKELLKGPVCGKAAGSRNADAKSDPAGESAV